MRSIMRPYLRKCLPESDIISRASERLECEVGSCRADFMNRNGELQFGPFRFNGRDDTLDQGFWIRRVATNEN